MIVVKFGGSSLASAERMIAAARIVARHRRREPVVCVVSAMQGVTDQLIAVAQQTQEHAPEWQQRYSQVRQRHERAFQAIAASGLRRQPFSIYPTLGLFDVAIAGLASQSLPDGERDKATAVFSAWGERLSVRLFAAALARVGVESDLFEDAPVIVERARHGSSSHWEPSFAATTLWLRDSIGNQLHLGRTPVAPGYLALRQDGAYTTLGRNGSDHSAAILGAALGARAVYLYSDVAGIYAADPHTEPTAPLLRSLSYDEASAIAAGGARVLHPATIPPLAQARIPLHLRSVFDPDGPGTDIGTDCTGALAEPGTVTYRVSVRVENATTQRPMELAGTGLQLLRGRLDAY